MKKIVPLKIITKDCCLSCALIVKPRRTVGEYLGRLRIIDEGEPMLCKDGGKKVFSEESILFDEVTDGEKLLAAFSNWKSFARR